MDDSKRKRMESNRESARRSRMRKQKHLDDLNSQVSQLRNENNQILAGISVATQHFLNVEAENSILRAQMTELSHRLESLNEIIIINCICRTTDRVPISEGFDASLGSDDGFMDVINPISLANYLGHPIVAAPAEAMLQY